MSELAMETNEISDDDRSERTLASSAGMENTLESNLSLICRRFIIFMIIFCGDFLEILITLR